MALGGGPVAPGLLDWAAAAGIPVVPVYGMTETCSQVVAGIPGRALEGVDLALGDDGEILFRGAMVAAGAVAEDGWLHTGDRGRLDADGRLYVEDRIKDLIVTGGENVAPAAVEAVLSAHPAVADAGVVGEPDPDWGEAVAAFVVLRGAGHRGRAARVVPRAPGSARGPETGDRAGRSCRATPPESLCAPGCRVPPR